jgi:hypothetical protein
MVGGVALSCVSRLVMEVVEVVREAIGEKAVALLAKMSQVTRPFMVESSEEFCEPVLCCVTLRAPTW